MHELDAAARSALRFGFAAPEQDAQARRIELIRLLRQAPAISEATWIGIYDRRLADVSRASVDAEASGRDFNHDAAVIQA